MNWKKADETRALLRSELESAAARTHLGPRDRAAWVAVRLEEYVARFQAALEVPNWSLADLAGSDTLGVIEVGADVLGQELRRLEPGANVMRQWRTFDGSLTAIQDEVRDLRSPVRRLVRAIMRIAGRRDWAAVRKAGALQAAIKGLRVALDDTR